MAEFTQDWFSRYPDYWRDLFRDRGWRPEIPRTVIEIGSHEGRSALWMLENLLQHPASRLHCVDIFPDRDRPDSYWHRFAANVLASPHAGKVTVAAMASLPFMSAFVASGERVDFVYVDGSHRAADVLEDLVLAFHATRPGGIIICDDYLKGTRTADITLNSPKLGVDAFTTLYRDRLDIPWGQPLYQLAMIKTADRSPDDPGARGA
jgi:predicted O-methyltransferase YrrM